MAEGFLGRWSQRKQQVRSGRQPEDPLVEADSPAGVELPPAPVPEPDPGAGTAAGDAAAEGEAAPAPTLVDVQGLTPESDFKPFVGRSVAPERAARRSHSWDGESQSRCADVHGPTRANSSRRISQTEAGTGCHGR